MPGARRRRQNEPDVFDDEDPFDALVDRVLDHPQMRGVLESTQAFFDSVGFVIDRAAQRKAPKQAPRQKAAPPPRPPQKPRVDPIALARATLHFGPQETLNTTQIKKRRRDLAALCHPDRGGSTQAMQSINDAANILLASLK